MTDLHQPEYRFFRVTPEEERQVRQGLLDPGGLQGYYARGPSAREAKAKLPPCTGRGSRYMLDTRCLPWKPALRPLDTEP